MTTSSELLPRGHTKKRERLDDDSSSKTNGEDKKVRRQSDFLFKASRDRALKNKQGKNNNKNSNDMNKSSSNNNNNNKNNNNNNNNKKKNYENVKNKSKQSKEEKGEDFDVDDDDDDKPQFSQTKPPKKVHPLTFKQLSVGTTLMGIITGFKEFGMNVSLPNGLSAYIPATEISDEFNQLIKKSDNDEDESMDDEDDDDESMDDDNKNKNKNENKQTMKEKQLDLENLFQLGEPVICSVIQVKNNNSLVVSLRPSVVNSQDLVSGSNSELFSKGCYIYAAVKSREERGYILSGGVNIKETLFLGKKHIQSIHPKIGKPFLLKVVKNGKINK